MENTSKRIGDDFKFEVKMASDINQKLAMHMNLPAENHKIYNNTFTDCDIKLRQYYRDVGTANGTEIKNNIVSELINKEYLSQGMLSNNIETRVSGVDPLFVNKTGADFHLQANSPAVDTGTDVGLSKDFDGKSVPYGTAPDIGAYEYRPLSGILYGDVSGDSEVTAYDAALTAQASVELINLTADQTKKADVDGNSEVSAYDAALIAQYSVGIINKFPVEG